MSEATSTTPRTATYFVTHTIYVPILVQVQVNIPLDGSQPQTTTTNNYEPNPFNQFLNNMFLHSQSNPEPHPRISKEFFDSLPTLEIQDQNELNKMDPCAICLDEFKTGEKAVQLPCSHTFHEEDIKEWLKNSPTCPNCRFELPLEDPELEKARMKRMEEKSVKQQQQQQQTVIPPSHSDTSTQTEDNTTTQNISENNTTSLHNNDNNSQSQSQSQSHTNIDNTTQTQTQTNSPTPSSNETILQESTTSSPSPSFGIKRGFLLKDAKNKKNSPKSSSEEDSFLSGFKRGFLQNNNKKQKKN